MSEPEERPFKESVKRGFKRRCPNCGIGAILNGYLKVNDNCPHCNEELFHQRADDGPAYVTTLLAGHILAPLMIFTFDYTEDYPYLSTIGFMTLFVCFALYFLPRVKGAFVGLQWAKRMHGFGLAK